MLPNRLDQLRRQHNLTHQQMTDKLGISRQAYGHYENRNRETDYETLKKIADFFHTSIDYLLGRTDNTSQQCNNQEKLVEQYPDLSEIDQDLLRRIVETTKEDPYQSLFFDDILSAPKDEREEIVRGLLKLRKKYKK